MIRGKVIGRVWGTRKAPGLANFKLALVAVSKSDQLMVCIDTLEASVDDQVLVSVGSGARNIIKPGPDNREVLCDAAISQIVDGCSNPVED